MTAPPGRRLEVEKPPHYGRIDNWRRIECEGGLGYLIVGRSLDHPTFGGASIQTSYVVAHDSETGEIRTRNSRYTLVGPETILIFVLDLVSA
jgi:hypothetical protein